MIFVCVGSREYQFDRLLKEVDRLVETGVIAVPVFAQIGCSIYIPRHCSYERFLDRERFSQLQEEAEVIISHGGTGALIGALKMGKKVIAVPRLAKYGEHIDDHQMQISGVLADEDYLRQVLDMDELGSVIQETFQGPAPRPWHKESRMLQLVETFLNSYLEVLEKKT